MYSTQFTNKNSNSKHCWMKHTSVSFKTTDFLCTDAGLLASGSTPSFWHVQSHSSCSAALTLFVALKWNVFKFLIIKYTICTVLNMNEDRYGWRA